MRPPKLLWGAPVIFALTAVVIAITTADLAHALAWVVTTFWSFIAVRALNSAADAREALEMRRALNPSDKPDAAMWTSYPGS